MKPITGVLQALSYSSSFRRYFLVVRFLPLLLVALIIVSAFAEALDNHPDLEPFADCPDCKVMHDLSSGNKMESLLLMVPEFVEMDFASDSLSCHLRIVVSSIDSRGPPYPA